MLNTYNVETNIRLFSVWNSTSPASFVGIIITEFYHELTLMHIHMEMGRVTSISRIEIPTNNQPQSPMSEFGFSKAGRDENKCYQINSMISDFHDIYTKFQTSANDVQKASSFQNRSIFSPKKSFCLII